ncbi:hypothetical protein [Vulcanococcus limneticus]|uniref:hypothetical protein n=1 Tax=Vulcanococcus limneticus TaxID=2170428 RepID=UPI00398BBF3B
MHNIERILIPPHQHRPHPSTHARQQHLQIRQARIDQEQGGGGAQSFGAVGSGDWNGTAFGTSRGVYGTHQQTPTRSDLISP